MCVIEVTDKGLLVTELHPEFTKEQVQEATEAKLIFSSDLKEMKV
jgi:acetate CoA/acetoacetate CoA-transferase beta subunit